MIDSGNTAWLLMSTALVMLMLPGLALFYGGLVRAKNVLSTIMHSFFGLAIVTVVWVIVGFSLAFGSSIGDLGIVGGFDYIFFNGVGMEPAEGSDVPFVLFATFQMMFAAITPALISGAFAERKRFAAFVVFTVAWSILVYAPMAHMVWGGGILAQLGALDFAGGTVVHIASGVSALVVALVMGRRVAGHHVEPHDVPMTVLGAGLLWFGWFGFNAGSALAADGLAAQALMVTTVSAAAGTLTWVGASYLKGRKVSVVGAAAGAVAGLVAITPAAGFVTVGGALALGLVAGAACFAVTLLRERLAIDDSLDVFAVHGVGGIWGAVGTGIFAVAAIGGVSGLIEGNVEQLLVQVVAVAFTVVFASVMTFVIIKVIDVVLGLRVDEASEEAGLDIAVHGETAYVPWAGTSSGGFAAAAVSEPAAAAVAEAEPA
ncbi:MAG TPA: ammonium transporter [Anaerolineae bacterium]|nr:ammonium transporter [Anaerolineae bacterium]